MATFDTAYSDQGSTPLSLPSVRQMARKAAVALVAVAAGVLLITSVPGLQALPEHFRGADASWIAAALALEVASTVSFALAYHGVFDRRTDARTSASTAMAVQGVNILVPSGGTSGLAVGAAILSRSGVPRGFAASRSVALFLLTSLVTFAAIFAAGVSGTVGLLPGDVPVAATLLPAAGAALVVVGVLVLPRVIGDAPRETPGGRVRGTLRSVRALVREGVQASIGLLRAKDPLVIAGAIGYLAFDVAALVAVFHALGVDSLPLGTLILAYTLGHAGAIVPVPGSGEAGLVGMFALYGASLTGAAAAILAYRAIQAGVPALLGAAGIVDVRRRLRTPAGSGSDLLVPRPLSRA